MLGRLGGDGALTVGNGLLGKHHVLTGEIIDEHHVVAVGMICRRDNAVLRDVGVIAVPPGKYVAGPCGIGRGSGVAAVGNVFLLQHGPVPVDEFDQMDGGGGDIAVDIHVGKVVLLTADGIVIELLDGHIKVNDSVEIIRGAEIDIDQVAQAGEIAGGAYYGKAYKAGGGDIAYHHRARGLAGGHGAIGVRGGQSKGGIVIDLEPERGGLICGAGDIDGYRHVRARLSARNAADRENVGLVLYGQRVLRACRSGGQAAYEHHCRKQQG